MGISKLETLHLLNSRGYEILVETRGNSKFVTFTYGTSTYNHTISYSLEFSDYEIHLDMVYDLLAWSGLKVKYTLDY